MSSDSYPSLFGAWTRASSQLFTSVLEANRAAMTAFSPPQKPDVDAEGRPTEERIAPDADLPEWEVELDAGGGELSVGDVVRFTKTIAEADVRRFAAASGDTNPLHLDEEFAAGTRFGGRIAHGILVSGLISAALARLPGDIVYLSQDVQFLKPVRMGDRVTATIEAAENLGGNRFRLTTRVLDDDGETVIDGEATILVDE